MCIGIPHQIVKLNKNKATGNQGKILDSSLVSVKIGDWVLEQDGLIITKITPKQAKNVLKLMKKKFQITNSKSQTNSKS